MGMISLAVIGAIFMIIGSIINALYRKGNNIPYCSLDDIGFFTFVTSAIAILFKS